jgi:Transcriptional regulator LmrA/YxaF-like, C-terminal domain
LIRHGLDEPTARRLTIAMVAALEGAFILARALRNTEPLHAAGTAVASATRQAFREATTAR